MKMANYYIADTHFGHQNAIRFDNRPWNTAEEMTEGLIERWNSVVNKGDTVYILGDFLWDKSIERQVLGRLKGHKALIKGNHFRVSEEGRQHFIWIKDYAEIKDSGYNVIMCHYPIPFYRASYDPHKIMLCGHVHTTAEDVLLTSLRKQMRETREKTGDKSLSCGNILNVGCMKDYMDYTPRDINYLVDVLNRI